LQVPRSRARIADPANDVLVSAATVWEISIKRALGKLDAPPTLVETIGDAGFVEVPVTAADGARAGDLEPLHRDPFDRMLVAQAERLGAVVVTRDPVFAQCGVETVRA
jgi:PIN domain nuclease of toxin-antitoxin system